jgi:hypothetical protein
MARTITLISFRCPSRFWRLITFRITAATARTNLGATTVGAAVFTAATDIVARANVYAAPFDALAHNGMQINGSFDASQELGNTGLTLASGTLAYFADQWRAKFSRAATLSVSVRQTTLNQVTNPSGFPNGAIIIASTGLTTLAANDYAYISQPIEGYRVQRLWFGNASPQSVTIGFWANATIAGNLAVSLANSAANRSIVKDVAITTGLAYYTVTFAGDTTGTWLYDNGIGLEVRFCVGSGSNQQIGANTWSAANGIATSATTNFMATTNNIVSITGVIALPGTEAPSATRSALVMRPLDQELLLAKRYFRLTSGSGNGEPSLSMYGSSGGNLGLSMTHPVQMRVTPTPSVTGAFTVSGCGQPTVIASDPTSYFVYSTLTATGIASFVPGGSGVVKFDARF